MTSNFKKYKKVVLFGFMLISVIGYTQSDTSKWKLQLAFGFNYPNVDGFVTGFEAKPINFPTINLGVQHMFTKTKGVKLDFGYNRFSNTDNSAEFKTNYSRINAQFVYDATTVFGFLPTQIGLVGHIGPGFSTVKPLGSFGDNKTSFLNAMAGIEVHYNMSETFSVFTDFSYIFSLSGDETYNPISEGFGTFNGNLFTVTIGVSVSLSGCYYCD
ncbi:MAG: cell envelope biogenesis protein OmpA [Flavobacteriaceae bacterium]|nr:cell envelope biogenesis protein OmpA [Flavobacteriaceae bacterium]